MAANTFKKILCTTVSALALVTAFAPPAMAFTPMNMSVVAMSSASRNSTNHVVEAAYQRVDQLIGSATPSHLASAEKDIRLGIQTSATQGLHYSNSISYQEYAVQCQKEVNPNNAISTQQVTKSLRQEFLNCLQKKEAIDVASANPQSHSFSLNSSYLAQCQSVHGVKPGESLTHNFNLAQKTYDCVTAKQAEQDHGNALTALAAVIGGLGVLGIGFGAYESYSTRRYLQKSKGPSL